MLPKPFEPSTGSEVLQSITALVRGILDAFRLHPYIFMLRSAYSSEDPVYPFAHQLDLIARLFPRRPVRALIGDEIGLGKTVEAIMILKYLVEIGEVKRTLVLVPRVLIRQWLGELRRFGFRDIYQLERETIGRYADSGFAEGIYIASIDLAKKKEYRGKLTKVRWDLVIVDEAHRVGKVGSYETQRYNLVKELVKSPDVNVLLLTATPHRGKTEDYIERIRLLDPYLQESYFDREIYRSLINAIVFRRTKHDVNDVYEKRRIFTDCKFKARVIPNVSEKEKEFYKKIIEFLRKKLLDYHKKKDERPEALHLLIALIAKRASSSPRAAVLTLDRILARRSTALKGVEDIKALDHEAKRLADSFFSYSLEDIGFYSDEAETSEAEADAALNSFAERCSILLSDDDIAELKELHKLAKEIAGNGDSRLMALVELVKHHLSKRDRIVIFTEYLDTASYVYEELVNRLQDYRDKIILVTSQEIKPPGSVHQGGERPTIENVKDWLRKGLVDVIVSTDFASEGLNLQHANIVVHYEPTWSPVKIIQRIGRVWRVGQKKNVYSYSILLNVDSDVSVLKIIYAKLLSWFISGIESKVAIGEELEIDMLSREGGSLLLSIPLSSEKKGPKYSEHEARLEFLKGKRELERYAMRVLEILKRLKEEAEKAGLEDYGGKEIKVEKVEGLLEVLGNLYGGEAEEALRELLVSLAKVQGYSVNVGGDRVYIEDYDGLRTVQEFYNVLVKLASGSGGIPSALIVEGEALGGGKALHLYRIEVSVGGRPCYSEAAGILVMRDGSLKKVRGAQLLKLLASALKSVIGPIDQVHYFGQDMAEQLKNIFLSSYPEHVFSGFVNYLEKVRERFGGEHQDWVPSSLSDVKVTVSPLSSLIALTAGDGAPPPAHIEKVERMAMELAMRFEKEQGRVPKDVSAYQHYDIESRDPAGAEVRYIEVKGMWGLGVSLEITKEEFKVARELADRYWLYIVLGLSTGNPILLAVRDPGNRLRWSPVVKSYRLAEWESAENEAGIIDRKSLT